MSVTYCIVTDDGTNCSEAHIPCLATKDQDEHYGLVHVTTDDGRVQLEYGPNWQPGDATIAGKEPPR